MTLYILKIIQLDSEKLKLSRPEGLVNVMCWKAEYGYSGARDSKRFNSYCSRGENQDLYCGYKEEGNEKNAKTNS